MIKDATKKKSRTFTEREFNRKVIEIQKEAKRAVVAERQRLHDLFMHAPSSVAVLTGPNLTFELANEHYRKLLGVKRNIDGRALTDVLPDLEPALLKTIHKVAFKGQRFTASELPVLLDWDEDGTKYIKYFNLVYEPTFDKKAKPNGFIAFANEITEQIKTRQKVEEREKYYRSLLEYSADVTALRDRKGDLIFVTSSISKVLGYSVEEYQTYNKWELIHPDDHGVLKEAYVAARKKPGKPFRYQTRIRHKDGTWRWVEGVGTDLVNDPVVQGVVSNFRDITREKEAEARLEQSEERLRNATVAAAVGTWRTNLLTQITTRDASLNKLLGFKSEVTAVPNEKFIDFVYPADREIVNEAVRKLYAKKGDLDIEFRFVRPDGAVRWVRDRGKLLIGKNKKSLFATGAMVDITSEKNLERQKDEFLGIASHELKTPVTSVKAYTQVLNLRFRKAGDSASADLVNKMDGQLDKLTTLINDLLDVTKIESGKLLFHEEYFDVNELITEIIEETQRTTEKHKLIKKLTSSKTIWGDRDRIGQVLINLLTNAIKYSPKPHDVIIKTAIKKDVLTFSVQDFGMGIPKHKHKHIFDRFFRVQGDKHETYPGLGLGLYISYEIVKRHNGKLWFESAKGKGSTFYFSLPVTLPKGEDI